MGPVRVMTLTMMCGLARVKAGSRGASHRSPNVGRTARLSDPPLGLARRFKDAVLSEAGARARCDRRTVSADLREDWPQALRDSGFDAAKPSAWIAEGLLIYLPADAEEQLFTGINSMAGHGSHVAVEDGARQSPGRQAEGSGPALPRA